MRKTLYIGVALLIIATISTFVYLNMSMRNTVKTSAFSNSMGLKQYLSQPAKPEGKEIFTFGTLPATINQNQQFKLPINLNSYSNAVTGFDLVIRFEPGKLKLVEAKSVNADYDVFTRQQGNATVMTAIQKLNAQTKHQFNKEPVIELTLLPLKNEKATVQIISSVGKLKTKLINDASKVIVQDENESIDVIAK